MGTDAMNREQITDSCRVIKSHASFIGTAAADVAAMPADYTPPCLNELEETEGVLRRALATIQGAKRTLHSKTKEAA